ncbi:SUMF1/EgtB/PvdO family nonheme iron enzyme [Acinetobacter tianfuensis]|uniref:Formylglycine-generating enzyme family protein n=1 Tax=Acinetobacter tianfuensis TaxID=2419603 RepID=A0A3A8EWZ3_9GAMM|nr:SUMF1/EgtB/PvdO family nonheme iron enzyme [Acinetobacter tianfuensis]RKG34584.1 formylglycine-generating enzyme family protein [Acinetobacter tianfuensis]
MKKIWAVLCFSPLFFMGCSQPKEQPNQSDEASAPNKIKAELCRQYSGVPQGWLKHKTAGMVNIEGGSYEIGNNEAYPEEKSLMNSQRTVESFYMDQTEVTNAQFEAFVKATQYVTEAEQQGEAAIFVQPKQAVSELGWWKLEKNATWKQPWGAHSQRKTLPNEPVRIVTLKDALAYADWLGHELPTEEQWEYAAKAFAQQRDVQAMNHGSHINANVWQGQFPYQNAVEDGFEDVAPVGCYEANPFGLYDMIGNIWEYTRSPFTGSHDDHLGNHQQLKKSQPAYNHYTIKGGSYLCADNYCARYRAAARQSQEANLAMSHVGFRTVYQSKK